MDRVFCCAAFFALLAGPAISLSAQEPPEPNLPLGSEEFPIRCDDPAGEQWYLGRLRDPEGRPVAFKRLGSVGFGVFGNIVDGYEVRGEAIATELFMDMYFFRYIETEAPPGFRLVHEYSDKYEYVGGRLHKFGEREPLTGEMLVAYDDGRPALQAKVKDGWIEGELTRYYEDGTVKETIPYQFGRRHGLGKHYRESGKLGVEYRYAKGEVAGEMVAYHESGKVEHRVTIRNGRRDGPFHSFFADGKSRVSGFLKNGDWDGVYLRFDETGKIVEQLILKDGQRIDEPAEP